MSSQVHQGRKRDGISPSIVPISTVKDDKMLGLILVTSARSRDLKIRTASGPLSDLENKPLRLVHTKCQEFVLHALSIPFLPVAHAPISELFAAAPCWTPGLCHRLHPSPRSTWPHSCRTALARHPRPQRTHGSSA